MPVNVRVTLRKALRQLEAEHRRIGSQISAIRGAPGGRTGNRPSVPSVAARRRRRMNPAARRAVSQRMQAYWAKRKAVKAKGNAKSGENN
jgi:hypothetical protein